MARTWAIPGLLQNYLVLNFRNVLNSNGRITVAFNDQVHILFNITPTCHTSIHRNQMYVGLLSMSCC